MRLAWHNITHDHLRFFVTVTGIACAIFLIVFQVSVLVGFLRAASKVIDATDSDIWIMARGVQCFEFPAPIERRLASLARSVQGVASVSRICTGVVQCKKPDGNHQLVTLVGADPDAGRSFPLPYLPNAKGALDPEALVTDSSNTGLLEAGPLPLEVELNRKRARITGVAAGFSTFLGSPYVFGAYADSARYIGLGPEETIYILVRVDPGHAAAAVKERLQSRLQDVDVWTREDFAHRSRLYWISQTGAGGAILLVAVLGFVVGLAIVAQAIYATTMENLEEYATLKAIGASRGFITRVVLFQAIICGLLGYLIGTAATAPLTAAARAAIPWIHTPAWLSISMLGATLVMCGLAAVISIRKALSVEPARVFRA